MTTRPGAGIQDELRLTRGKRLAQCLEIEIVHNAWIIYLRATDHDRPLTDLEGRVFLPVGAGDMSADRREASLRPGSQEIRGIIDGTVITETMVSRRHLVGCRVKQWLVDWSRPWIVYGEHWRWIRDITAQGSTWTATLEGRTEALQRSVGGRYGGRWTVTCPYELGSSFVAPASGQTGGCQVSLPFDGSKRQAGFRVDTITDRTKFRITSASIPVLADDWLRHGSIVWLWRAPDVTGVNTGTTTATTLADTTKTWTVDEHTGKWVRILLGAGAAVSGEAYQQIASNTVDTLTFPAKAAMSGWIGHNYDICRQLETNSLARSHVMGYTASTREVQLLIPVPADIVAGDSGYWTVGCDGLLSTCRDKFANQLRFGGDPFAPSTTAIIEPIGER
ncbi:MAG: DUF2163 domain-containing protein [Planctomycetota bacterium]